MAKSRTLFGELQYSPPISQFVGEVDVSKPLENLDKPIEELDSYDPLGINTLNADREVASGFVKKQEDSISNIASQGNLFLAAQNAKKAANFYARQAKDRNKAEGAAVENFNNYRTYQDQENKRSDIRKDVSNFLQQKTLHEYNKAGGVGEYDESGNPTNPLGFNRLSGIRTASQVDHTKKVKALEEGFEADIRTSISDSSGNGYITIDKWKREFVRDGDVSGYVVRGLLEDRDWVQDYSQVSQLEIYQRLLSNGMSSQQAFDYLETPEGKQAVNQLLTVKAANQAQQSGIKKGFVRDDAFRTKKTDAFALARYKDKLKNDFRGLTVQQEARVMGVLDTNSSKKLEEVRSATVNSGNAETQKLMANLEDKTGLSLDGYIERYNLLYTPKQIELETNKILRDQPDLPYKEAKKLAHTSLVETFRRDNPEANEARIMLSNPELVSHLQSKLGPSSLSKLRNIATQIENLEQRDSEANLVAERESKVQEWISTNSKSITDLGLSEDDIKQIAQFESGTLDSKHKLFGLVSDKYSELFGSSPSITSVSSQIDDIRKVDPEWVKSWENIKGNSSTLKERLDKYDKIKDQYLEETASGFTKTTWANTQMPGDIYNPTTNRWEFNQDVADDRTKAIRSFADNVENFSSLTGSVRGESGWEDNVSIGDFIKSIKEEDSKAKINISDVSLTTMPDAEGVRALRISINGTPISIPADQIKEVQSWVDSPQERLNTYLSQSSASGLQSKEVTVVGGSKDGTNSEITVNFPIDIRSKLQQGSYKFYNDGDFSIDTSKGRLTGNDAYSFLYRLMQSGQINF